jgi:hypothetical protein
LNQEVELQRGFAAGERDAAAGSFVKGFVAEHGFGCVRRRDFASDAFQRFVGANAGARAARDAARRIARDAVAF